MHVGGINDGDGGGVQDLQEEIKHLREALSKSQERVRSLKTANDQYIIAFEAAMDAIVAVSQDGKITLFNQAAEELFQYSAHEITGQPLKVLLRDGVGDIHQARMERFFSGAAGRCGHLAKRTEQVFRRKDGSLFDAEVAMSGGRSNGKGLMVSSIVDITERKAIENALQKSEEIHRLFLQNFSGIAYHCRIDEAPEFYHGAVKDITGYGSEEFTGRSIKWQDIVHPEDLPHFQNEFEKLLKMPDYASQREYRILHKNGHVKWVQEFAANRCDSKGKPKCYEGAIYDVTNQKMAEKEFLKMKNLDSIGRLAGGIAHDFNNLLMAVTGYISLAKTRVHPEDKVYELLSEAERISFMGKDLTQQLITFSKGGEPAKKVLNPASLIRDAVDSAIEGSGIKCKYLIPENLSSVECDEAQIRQAISNIAVNAKEAMVQGGSMVVRANNNTIGQDSKIPLAKGNYIQISIEDKGPGIPESSLSRVFDPYFSTKDMGGQRGMGLGLTVVYSIVKKHDGWVSADSTPGAGSIFHIFLPVHKGAAKHDASTAKKPERSKGKVLFMDDEKVIRDIAKQIIENIGYEPVLAEHGIEAIDLFKREKQAGGKFEAVIFDLTIKGGMGGKDTLKELIYIDPDIKAIISSGYTDDPVIARYRDYGFIGAITKPYKAKELKDLLESIITPKE